MKWIMDYSPSSFCKDFFRGARGGAGPGGEGGKGGGGQFFFFNLTKDFF